MRQDIAAEHFLEITCRNSPVVSAAIQEHGDVPLADFLKGLEPDAVPSFQRPDDLVDVVYHYAAPLLGESLARAISQDLAAFPVVLTANHHGVDFFAQSVQGSLLFSLLARNGKASGTTVPIFSCGAVPLDNLTYPLGLLLYHVSWDEMETMPKKLPVFSNRFRRALVSVSGPFDTTMVERAQGRLDRMIQDNRISSRIVSPLHDIFQEDYCAQAVMDLPSYSQQSVLLNNRIWRRLFSESTSHPEMVYLELEKIVIGLLESDLQNPESLASCVMFDPKLREAVSRELDGAKACWNLDGLVRRLRPNSLDSRGSTERDNCGTVFFWGINETGRRIPVCLENSGRNREMLRGIDDRGHLWELPYTPQSVLGALKQERLLPSLFTCFLVISFARGLTCAGGYFQSDYLPVMQRGLVNALQTSADYRDVATLVAGVTSWTYLSGMQTVMVRIKDDALIPAGPIEIIAGGGLTNADIEQMLSLTVRDAHLASLFETVPDVAPWALEVPDWRKLLAADCFRLLGDKAVVK